MNPPSRRRAVVAVSASAKTTFAHLNEKRKKNGLFYCCFVSFSK